MMQYCGNKELDKSNKNTMNQGNKTGLDYEEGDKSTETENEDMINRDININKTVTNQDTLYKVTE